MSSTGEPGTAMIESFMAALREGNFAVLHDLYTHGVVLHEPGGSLHSRELANAQLLTLYMKGAGATPRLVQQWTNVPARVGFTFTLGARHFAVEWRLHRERVAEIWHAESRSGEGGVSLSPHRLLPPFDVVHGFGQLAPAAKPHPLHVVWNRRDLRPVAHDPRLHAQAVALLERFPHLTATVEAALADGKDVLVRWRLQAMAPPTVIDVFACSTWQNGVWTATYLDEAVIEAQLRQPAMATLSPNNF